MTTTTTTNSKLTIANLKKVERDAKTLALRANLLLAREVAAQTRVQVDAYIAPVFAKFEFYADRSGERLTSPDRLYLVADLNAPEVKAFDAACSAAHREHGYDLPDGYCPALVAEEEVRQSRKRVYLESGRVSSMVCRCQEKPLHLSI